RASARYALARALAMRGRHETAATALAPLLEPSLPSDNGGGPALDTGFVKLLFDSFVGAGRVQQAHVARELRAVGGDLEEAERQKLDARSRPYGAHSEGLSAASLRSFVMPAGFGRHPIWDVAALCQGMAGKLAR